MTAGPVGSGAPTRPASAFALVRRFARLTRPYRRHVWIAIGAMILAAPLAVVSPRLVMGVIDQAQEGGITSEVPTLTWILIAMTFASVALGITNGDHTFLFHGKILRAVRVRLVRHLQGLSLRWHDSVETGWVMSRVQEDAANLDGVMIDAFARAAIEAVKAIAFLVMLVLLEWHLALGGLAIVIVVFGLQALVSPALRRRGKLAQERRAEVSEALHQGVSGHHLTRATTSERRELKRFVRVVHSSLRAHVDRDVFGLVSNHAMFLITGVAPILVILAGAWLIAGDELSVGGLFAFFMYLVYMAGAVAEVARLNPALQSSLVSAQRIFEILDTDRDVVSPTPGASADEITGRVCFEGVTFAYEPGRNVLEDVSFEAEPRQTIALVGPSGAGKSTLASLVPRFRDPTHGRILVDGRDLRTYDLSSLRRRIGVVPQDIFLFDRSVRENVLLGAPDAGPEALAAAARAAHADDFISRLPEGWDTLIGERGVRLSGGQRQRLAIARELLRDPRILILDEATSSLDSRSEELIREAMERLLAGRTALVIAHRLSTVIRADLILVLDQGRIVERGTHPGLLARDGLYRQLYQAQFASVT